MAREEEEEEEKRRDRQSLYGGERGVSEREGGSLVMREP